MSLSICLSPHVSITGVGSQLLLALCDKEVVELE